LCCFCRDCGKDLIENVDEVAKARIVKIIGSDILDENQKNDEGYTVLFDFMSIFKPTHGRRFLTRCVSSLFTLLFLVSVDAIKAWMI